MNISQKTEWMERISSNLILKTRKRFISAWTKETNMVSICCSLFIYFSVLQGVNTKQFLLHTLQFSSVLYSIPCYKKLEINTVPPPPPKRKVGWGGVGWTVWRRWKGTVGRVTRHDNGDFLSFFFERNGFFIRRSPRKRSTENALERPGSSSLKSTQWTSPRKKWKLPCPVSRKGVLHHLRRHQILQDQSQV